MRTFILSYKNFAESIPGIRQVLPPDHFVFSEQVPESYLSDNQDISTIFDKIFVLIASPVECHLFSGLFSYAGYDKPKKISRKELIDLQTSLRETYDIRSVKTWVEKSILTPFGINIFQVAFPSGGIKTFQREGYDLIFIRVGPEWADIYKPILELSGFGKERNLTTAEAIQDLSDGTQVGDLSTFPYSFLRESMDPQSFPNVNGLDLKNLFLSKFCDYGQTFPAHILESNMQTISKAFPNYVRKELYYGNVWFVDVPRTSSSSIKVELHKNFGLIFGKKNLTEQSFISTQIIPNHIPAKFMRRALGGKIWDSLFTFSIIRNPWDRMVSMYHYRKIQVKNIPEDMTFSEYIYLLNKDRGTGLFKYHGYYFSNADYLLDDHGEILVSYVGRYENRESDMKKIAEFTGIHDIGKIFTQKSRENSESYRQYYNAESRDIVADLFRKDLDLFGYTFDSHG